MSEHEFTKGEEFKLPNGSNVYELSRGSSGCVLLRCVWFGGKEGVGDQIFCTREGQEIWVAAGALLKFDRWSP